MKLVKLVIKCILLIPVFVVLVLSYGAFFSSYAANKEALLDQNLLVATNAELDVREALLRHKYADKHEECDLPIKNQ